MAEPATERGRGTRQRIILAAARLFHEQGVSATSVDEVLAAAGAGKGQLYRYFRTKDDLVSAVVDHRLESYLVCQREALEGLGRLEELERYLSDLVAAHARGGLLGGCPVGSLALELADRDESLRRRLAEAIECWEASLAVGLSTLASRGELRADVPPERMAGSLLATIQGAYLLATVRRDPGAMSDALEQALTGLRPDAATSRGLSARPGTK